MPKVPSPSQSHPTPSSTSEPLRSAIILRRNQACHQCRKRKLKCDAKRPCSTCVRSHKYAVNHAAAGTELPSAPDCTFDEVPDQENRSSDEQLKALENRITELEASLQERDQQTAAFLRAHANLNGLSTTNLNTEDLITGSVRSIPGIGLVGYDMFDTAKALEIGADSAFSQISGSNGLDNLADVASLMNNGFSSSSASPSGSTPGGPSASGFSFDQLLGSGGAGISSGHDELLHMAWPKTLPSPDLVHHLVEALFNHNVDACRLVHAPTFLASLSLPPTHPGFPSTGLLHAMCAMGSMYTAAVEPTPTPGGIFSPYDPFTEKYRLLEGRTESFAETQTRFAVASLDDTVHLGIDLFQNVQAMVVLSWWFWCNARWSEAYNGAAKSLRSSVPCGLNVCPPFNTIALALKPPSILDPAKNVVEDEVRRNTFWLAYSLERLQGCGNGWAMMLDDQDVSQLLPLRGDQFEKGILVRPEDRQWSHDNDVLLMHPPDQTDSFILYVKAAMLLSRVKNFNTRFRARQHKKDPATLIGGVINGTTDFMDVRKTPAFMEVDNLVTNFYPSFPPHMKNPVKGYTVDCHLFTACISAHLAVLTMHETHAMVGHSTCVSSRKILTAARGILDLLHAVVSTSYDISLLGSFAMISWYMAARVLSRFLRAAIDAKSNEQCEILRTEIDFIRAMISRVGERFPLAQRYAKMLQDFITQNCGEEYAKTSTYNVPSPNSIFNGNSPPESFNSNSPPAPGSAVTSQPTIVS